MASTASRASKYSSDVPGSGLRCWAFMGVEFMDRARSWVGGAAVARGRRWLAAARARMRWRGSAILAVPDRRRADRVGRDAVDPRIGVARLRGVGHPVAMVQETTNTGAIDDADLRWMRHAMALAERAEREDDEIPVGA